VNVNINKGCPWWVLITVSVVASAGLLFLGSGLLFPGARNGDASGHSADPGHGGEGHGGHGHGGDEPTVATTIWADRVDIFLERPYPVAGQPVEMLAHVTVIKNGSAVTTGSVTFEATGPDDSVVRVRVDAPTRPGIFIPEVTFPKPGTYRARLVIESPQVAEGGETIELPDVAVYTTAEAVLAAAEEAEEDAPADTISFLKEQQWPIGLLTVEAKEQELVEHLDVPARVIVPPGSGALVSSQITGKVLPPIDGRFPRIGEDVQQGQVLAIVEPSITGAEAVQMVANHAQLETLDAGLAVKQLDVETQIRSAELALARASEIHQRQERLSQQGVTAGKELLLAKYEVDLAETRLAGLKTLLPSYAEARRRLATVLGRMHSTGDGNKEQEDLSVALRSPIAGTIVEVKATSGELITGSHQLFRVVNLDTLWIEANVSEYDLSRVEQAPGASYRLAAYPDRVVPILDGAGRLIDIGVEVDPDTRTVSIRYAVANSDRTLRIGMFADLLVETSHRQKALAIPEEAVIDEGGEKVVYVQTGGESFQRRGVKLGIGGCNPHSHGAKLVEVLSGIRPGERVTTKAAYSVRLSTLSSSLPAHGHAH